jgi:hypothetical protein
MRAGGPFTAVRPERSPGTSGKCPFGLALPAATGGADLHYLPVEPKPPAPRTDSASDSTSSSDADS